MPNSSCSPHPSNRPSLSFSRAQLIKQTLHFRSSLVLWSVITQCRMLCFVLSSAHQISFGWSRRMRWAGNVARLGYKRGAYRVLMGRPEGRRLLGILRLRWEDDIKVALKNWDGLDWFDSEKGEVVGCCKCGYEPSGSIKCVVFFD